MSLPLIKLSDYAKHGKAALEQRPVVGVSLPAPKGRTVEPVRGRMNGTEQRYAKRLDARIAAGEVARFYYESLKFRLADGSWYTPDFMVLLANGLYQIHETKGKFIREAAMVRIKITSETYWTFPVFLVKEKPQNVFTVAEVGR